MPARLLKAVTSTLPHPEKFAGMIFDNQSEGTGENASAHAFLLRSDA
jgi:hypothetical protein